MPAAPRRQDRTIRFSSENSVSRGEARRDRKRAEIIDSAKEIFAREGYAGASMDQIAAKAGASKATVYSHFGSKEDLLSSVVDDLLEPVQIAMTGLPKTENISEWLVHIACLVGRQAMSPAGVGLSRLAVAEALRFPEIGRAIHSNGIATVEALVRPEIEAAIERGALRKSDPLVALGHLFEMSFGRTWREVMMGLRAPPSEAELERDVRTAISAFMDGYAVN